MRLAGTAVPVAGVGGIALDPVQVGMHPGARRVLLGLGQAVGLVPVAFGLVLERGQRPFQVRGRRVPVEGLLEGRQVHASTSPAGPGALYPP